MKKSDKNKYDKILKNIYSIKIQGAENVAKAGIKAFLLNPTESSAKRIINTRPTEPLLQNSLKKIINSDNKEKTANEILKLIKSSHQKIAENGSSIIKNDMKIYTHCHSSSVIDILKNAKKKGINFSVYTTEVEPLMQGRMTAKDLSKSNIQVTIGPDLAAEEILKHCDIFLFGADAITKNGIYNKIGTKTLCKIAKDYKIPRYSCTLSMKNTKKVIIEKRPGKQVWDERDKNIKPIYPAFDKTPLNLITGIISEFGINTPKKFLKKLGHF
jgi:translation initiation factor 2B subunit (eIF-2B alpha/beta/delta family)